MISLVLLFISGSAALVYQTLWVKQLSIIVGVDVYAVTMAVSAFFTGLALGSAILGQYADKMKHPFILYALLEAGVAVTGIVCTIILAKSPPLFACLQKSFGPAAWLLPFGVIGLPAFLMGGTIPVLLRAIQPHDNGVGHMSGLFYAANTAGAIIGTLAVPLYLVPVFGIKGAAFIAAAANVSACALAAFKGQKKKETRPVVSVAASQKPLHKNRALILYALAGGIALGYEVVWFKAIAQFLSSRTFAFGIMLSTYLLGLAMGSFLYSQFAKRDRYPWISFGILVFCAGFSALLIFAVIGQWLPEAQDAVGKWLYKSFTSNMISNLARFLLGAGVMVLVPTIFLGAAFPVAVKLTSGPADIGRDSGRVIGLNMVGGICGTFLTGFILIPRLGLIYTLATLALAAAFLGSIAVITGSEKRIRFVVAVSMMLCTAMISVSIPRNKFGQMLTGQRGGDLIFYDESARGVVAVVEQQAQGHQFRRLYIQGVSNSGDAMTSLRYMRLQALLPLIIHKGDPKSALVVGLGTGITCGALLAYPGLETRVCAELLPAVVRAAAEFEGNLNVTHDPKVEIRIADGRHDLLSRQRQYDLITLEPPPPPAAGVVNLYSREFYKLCAKRMAPNGLTAQWWPLPTQNHKDSQSIVKSFVDVFPHVTLWSTELHEMLLIGSNSSIELDYKRIAKRYWQKDVQIALSAVGIASPAALLSTYITDKQGLERYAGRARPITDNHPRIEYAGWVRKKEITRVLPNILQFRKTPNIAADMVIRQAVEKEHQQLMNFYRAGLHAYKGEKAQWISLMQDVLSRDPGNPYYLWVIGR